MGIAGRASESKTSANSSAINSNDTVQYSFATSTSVSVSGTYKGLCGFPLVLGVVVVVAALVDPARRQEGQQLEEEHASL